MTDAIVTLFVLLVLTSLVSIKRWPEWLRRMRASGWPTVPGIVESGEVSTFRGRSSYTYRAQERATANLGYSYTLDGAYYSGYHTAVFDDEQEAWSYVDSLRGKAVQVSYNPRKPDISVLRFLQ